MRRRARRTLIIATVTAGGLIIATIAGFAVDRSRHSGMVARNVTVDGREVGGSTGPELQGTVQALAASWASTPVEIATPKGNFPTTVGALGISLDQDAVVRSALAIGNKGNVLTNMSSWFGSLFGGSAAPLTFTLDEAKTPSALAEAEKANHVDPVEPALLPGDKEITVKTGTPGATLDPDAIARSALARAQAGDHRIRVEATTVPLPTVHSDSEAQLLADEANKLATQPLGIYVGDKSGRFDQKTIRGWFIPKIGPAGLELDIDGKKLESDVVKVLGQVGVPVKQLAFTVDPDDKVTIIDGVAGTRCCTPDAGTKVLTALKNRSNRADLQLTPVLPDHDRAWGEKLGITTKVGEFTTRHPCCEARVTNIHLFADSMRGRVLEPGKTLSLNDTVGQRTKEKGYVEAPVIYDSTHSTDIGGGVSQFATTTFNAAFFAGLDIPEYQMHSLFIDRYPYGREATISWDQPDLAMRNNTPYGVLVWTSYTDTTITVSLYSTPWIKGEQGNQTREPKGPCTKVTTERIRTRIGDDKVKPEIDRFFALYQPEDGVKC